MQHKKSFTNQQNAIENFEPLECNELFFVSWQVIYF